MRIASWNVWGFEWRWRERLPLVAAEICAVQPDILLLQETRSAAASWEQGLSTAQQIADRTGLRLERWIDAQTADDAMRLGPAALTSLPSSEVVAEPLCSHDEGADIGFHESWLLTLRFELSGATTAVATTHLPVSRPPEAQRRATDRLIEKLPAHTEGCETVLLMGDLNLQPHSPLLWRMMRDLDLASAPRLNRAPPTWPTDVGMHNAQLLEDGFAELMIHPDAPAVRIDHA